MTLGSWAIIREAPSLLAMLPLLIFIVVSFKKNVGILFPILIGVLAGWLLTGNTPTTFGSQLVSAMGSEMGRVGLLIMFAGGLGEVLRETGISATFCKIIIKRLSVHGIKQAYLVLMICEFCLAYCLGSFGSATAIVLPILLPLLGMFGAKPVATTLAALLAGTAGILSAPFCSYTQMAMTLTNLSYLQYLIYGGLPYSLILTVSGFFIVQMIQKKVSREGAESYPHVLGDQQLDLAVSPEMKKRTFIFMFVFFACIIYAIAAHKKTAFVLFLLPSLTCVAGLLAKCRYTRVIDTFCDGCKKYTTVFLCMLLYKLLMVVIDVGGGFTALGNLMIDLCGDSLTPQSFMIVSIFVGAFGIGGDNAAQMQILQSVFQPLLDSTGLNPKCWLIVLLAGSFLTNAIYPSAGILGQMATCNCTDTKNMMLGMWIASAVILIACIIYSLIGPGLIV